MVNAFPPRFVKLLTAAVAVLVILVWSAPNAAGDSTNGVAVCHGSMDAGVEVDTCTGDPTYDVTHPDEGVLVRPEFCFGIGFSGCDD